LVEKWKKLVGGEPSSKKKEDAPQKPVVSQEKSKENEKILADKKREREKEGIIH